MHLRCHESFRELPAAEWNTLVRDEDPFLQHAFLVALENHGVTGPGTHWQPRPLSVRDDDGRLLGGCPLFLKTDSWGEFVFDWGWADAYHRNGLRYYPKLVAAIPHTPATGQRLLVAAGADAGAVMALLAEGARELAAGLGCSTLHVLFPQAGELESLAAAGLTHRLGCQFHWQNPGYRDFDDFLDAFSAKKRKNLRQERRRVREAGLELERLPGNAVSEAQWRVFHRFYRNTFEQRGCPAPMSLPFFLEIGRTLGERVLLVLARRGHDIVAAAISYAGARTLYGRHWGCAESFDALHFEACYYQGIEHCIEHGLTRFEPGAQGEHKVARGFEPVLTHSAHWVAHPGFRQAIDAFLHRERPAIVEYARELTARLPYRSGEAAA